MGDAKRKGVIFEGDEMDVGEMPLDREAKQQRLRRKRDEKRLTSGPINVPRDFLPDDDLSAAMAFRNAAGSQCNVVIGDPAAARESVSRFVAAGVDELICVMQMGTVPHELVMQSIRTFGEEVIPAFR